MTPETATASVTQILRLESDQTKAMQHKIACLEREVEQLQAFNVGLSKQLAETQERVCHGVNWRRVGDGEPEGKVLVCMHGKATVAHYNKHSRLWEDMNGDRFGYPDAWAVIPRAPWADGRPAFNCDPGDK